MGITLSPRWVIAGKLLFIAAVTCYLLARMLAGAASQPEMVLYGATAAFGLEFVLAAWRELWKCG
jgi:hypothetical protein